MLVSEGPSEEIAVPEWAPAPAPATTGRRLDVTFPAVAATAPLARRSIASFVGAVGVRDDILHDVRLAVSEAVSNVVLHAYPDRAGTIELTAGLAGDELRVRVADRGCGFREPSRNPGLGLGLGLIADASEEFVMTERATGGTELRMLFRLRSQMG